MQVLYFFGESKAVSNTEHNKQEPVFRPAVASDGPAVTKLVFDVLAEYGLKHDPEGADADLKDICKSYHESGGAFFVLEGSDVGIVGSYGLYKLDERTCELRKMYLRADYRSRGWGRQMMQRAIDEARGLDFTRIILETASVLTEAIALYERFGFVRYETGHLSERCVQACIAEL